MHYYLSHPGVAVENVAFPVLIETNELNRPSQTLNLRRHPLYYLLAALAVVMDGPLVIPSPLSPMD